MIVTDMSSSTARSTSVTPVVHGLQLGAHKLCTKLHLDVILVIHRSLDIARLQKKVMMEEIAEEIVDD